MNILQLIASDSFITVNKELIKQVGLEEAIMIGELASEYDYWQKNNGLTEDGYFFSTRENVEEKTTLTDHKQRKALNKLKELGLVDVSLRGLPAKRYIKFNEENILKLFETKCLKISNTSTEKIQTLDSENFERNNNISNKNITNNNINGESKDSGSTEKVDISSSKTKTTKRSRKDQIVDYIESLEYQQETKDYLFKWIFQIGLDRGVTVKQLQDMLKNLWESCNNESTVKEAIKNSYLNNWFGFYPPKTTGKNPSFTVKNTTPQNIETHFIPRATVNKQEIF